MGLPAFRLFKELWNFLPGRGVRRWEDVHAMHAGAPTVVLVSGFTAPRRTLSVFRRRLKRDGFNVLVVALDKQFLSEGVSGFLSPAEKLARRIEELLAQKQIESSQVVIVAHSAGGLVARYYVQWLGGFRACRALITVATPHRGTWLALAGLCSHFILKARCLFQLLPGSRFLRKLNSFPYPDGFPLVSLYSREDPICPARCSRIPKGWAKREDIRTVEVRHLSHSDFLLRKRAYRVILGYLTEFVKPAPGEITQTKSTLTA